MSGEDIVIMSVKELRRVSIIQKVIEKQLSQTKAADVLGLSARQIRRIIKRVIQEGNKGIVHKSRGKPSGRKLSESLKNKALQLYQKKYHDFGPTLANEKLLDEEGIKISTQTLRNWLITEGLWQNRRKRKKHRQWRQRKEYLGEMVQMDGSHHDWLEGRGPKLVLMGYIDDATNKVFGRFYDYEGTMPAFDSFKRYIQRYGIPQSVYLDKHSTYKSQAKASIEDELNNRKPMSQFERALDELGVQVIHAHSPQAKGRIERLFGTLQDRLIKEMRLKGISSKTQANKFLGTYLPVYNKRFSFKAAQTANLHRPRPRSQNISEVLCVKKRRTVRNDSTIAYNKKLYQLADIKPNKKVIVHEKTDESIVIKYQEKRVKFKEIQHQSLPACQQPENDKVANIDSFKTNKTKNNPLQPKNHPWRNFSFGAKTGHF